MTITVRFFLGIEEEFFSFSFWNVCGNVTEDGEFWNTVRMLKNIGIRLLNF